MKKMVRGTVTLKDGTTVFIAAQNMMEAAEIIRDKYWWQMDSMEMWTAKEEESEVVRLDG